MQAQDCERGMRGQFARSAGCREAKWQDCEPGKAVLGTGGKISEGALVFFFFSLIIFFQKYHFNQSFDNYETCQLRVRIHQMCCKWQETRTQILKLDGFQKSLTITTINHSGTSISGQKRFCRRQKCETKFPQRNRAPLQMEKDSTPLSGWFLKLQRLGPVMQQLW